MPLGVPLLDEDHLAELQLLDGIDLPAGPRASVIARILGERESQVQPLVRLVEDPASLERRIADMATGLPLGTTLVIRDHEVAELSLADMTQVVEPGSLRLLPISIDDPIAALRQILARLLREGEQVRDLGLIPFFPWMHRGSQDDGDRVMTRMAGSFWGLFPGDVQSDELRALHHELIKLLHPERYLRFLAFENHALAGFDLYDEAMRGRELDRPLADAPRRQRAMVIAIDGIDGAGKSSQLQSLADHLEQQGRSCIIHKIYRHGVFHDTVTDVTRLCAGPSHLHLWRLQRIAKVFDSLKYYFAEVEADLDRYDVVLFDRYVGTHLAAGLGRYHHDPYARELLSVFPPADRTYLLDLDVNVALDRIARRPVRTVDENPYMLAQYRQALLAIAQEEEWVVLDSQRGESNLRELIRADVDAFLRGMGA